MKVGTFLAAGCAAILVGCTGGPPRAYPPIPLLTGDGITDLDAPPRVAPSGDIRTVGAVESRAVPKAVLALSGGGMYGAFSVGVLKGWSEAGNRPQFDVVTGISTGSLIAPFAFLGPEYDEFLAASYTTIRARDVYRKRTWLNILQADSFADAAPLRARIASQVTPDILDKIAAAYAAGRRLYVGTTELDAQHLVVWDMGAIASSGRPDRLELFRTVLLASCSVPGFFAPVPINVQVDGKRFTELHADGGVGASVFVPHEVLSAPRAEGGPQPQVFVVVAGKTDPDPQYIKPKFISLAGGTIDGLLQARMEGDLCRIYYMSERVGARFRLAAVPDTFPIDPDFLSFDPKEMKQLFDVGWSLAKSGQVWQDAPPGVGADGRNRTRFGVRFSTRPPEPDPAPR
jgi:predicted acylesterase/phospholipase RssA